MNVTRSHTATLIVPTLRLFAFSDPHADVAAMRRLAVEGAGADLLVGAGDFGDRGRGATAALEALDAVTCPVLIVSGNHDRLPELHAFAATRANIHLLHGSAVQIGGLRFLGIGSAIARREPSPNSEWMHEDEATRLLSPHTAASVLISHTPPAGAADKHPSGQSGGSTAVRDAVLRLKPALCLCGHVHNEHRTQQLLGTTLVHNLGPDGYLHELPVPPSASR